MTQRLRWLLASFVLTLTAPTCFALGLGDLELKSALNQQFHAEIELTNVRALSVEEIIPNLGTQKDFKRAGVERSYVLIDLRFKVESRPNGQLYVRITSTKPIIEPFLDFIVEVLWPSGRILKEYTVLLDPPVFGKGGVEPIEISRSQQRTPAPRPTTPVQPEPSGQVQPGEPETARISSPEARQPVEPVQKQGKLTSGEYGITSYGDTLWKIAISIRPDNSVSIQQTMLALKDANPEAFINDNINLLKAGYVLRIPTERELRATSVGSAIAEVKVQNEEFAAYKNGTSLAQLDASRRRRSSDSASETVDDGELKLLAPDQSSGERAGAGDGDARAQELENELLFAEEELSRSHRANTELNVRFNDLEEQLDSINRLLALKDDQLAALKVQVTKLQANANNAGSAPPPVTEPVANQYLSLLSNPIVLGVLGLIVVGGVAGVLVLMRRRRQDLEDDDELEEDVVIEAMIDDDDEEDFKEPESEDEDEDEDFDQDQEISPETGDVISEVEIYIAYGRFPEAITFLQKAMEAEPVRLDIQLKLLEVYVQTEDTEAFDQLFDQLKLIANADVVQQAQALRGDALEEADLSFDLDDLGSETEDDELNLDDGLDLDAGTDDDDAISLDLDGDDEISLDLDDDDEISLDLDDDDEISLDLDDDDEISLDLDDDDEISLDLDDDDEISLDLDDDDEISLDLDDEDEISLDLDDDDEISLDLDDEDEISLDLDGDDEISLDLGDDEISLDLDDDDFSLDLDDDGAITLDLDDDDGNVLEEDDGGNKLDLARAYIDMGDGDGARSVLEKVISEGTDSEVKEANELLEKID